MPDWTWVMSRRFATMLIKSALVIALLDGSVIRKNPRLLPEEMRVGSQKRRRILAGKSVEVKEPLGDPAPTEPGPLLGVRGAARADRLLRRFAPRAEGLAESPVHPLLDRSRRLLFYFSYLADQ
jgi:hypothetical protein